MGTKHSTNSLTKVPEPTTSTQTDKNEDEGISKESHDMRESAYFGSGDMGDDMEGAPFDTPKDTSDENSSADNTMDSGTDECDVEYRGKIIEHYRFLKDNLDADSALDVLAPFFSERDLEDINAIVPRYRKVDKMLQKLCQLPRGSDAFHALKESFETNGSLFILEELQKQVLYPTSSSLTLTTEEKRQNMRKYNKRLMNEIDPNHAHEFFMMRKAISLDKYAEIEDESTPNRKIKQLLEHIDEKLPECYDVLVAYLSEKQQTKTKDLLSRPWAEGTNFKLHITLDEKKQDLEVSKRVVEALNIARIKLEINDELIPLKSCSIKLSSSGSIEIWFKKFRGQVRTFFKKDQLAFITDIIEMVFDHK
ncbi:hypothetical protein MAR_006106, partial [Mya arenaria]